MLKYMNKLIPLGCGIASLLAISLISSCGSTSESEILNPASEQILGKWEIKDGYILNDGQWEKHDDPDSSMTTYFFQDNDSIRICSTDKEGWSSYSMVHYKVDDADMTVKTGSAESKIELLTADSLVMVSDFLHNPTTGEPLDEPIHYKWGFRRMASNPLSIGEMLIGKWKFLITQEKVDGVWKCPADVPTPTESTQEFNANGFHLVNMVFQGQHYKTKYNWKVDNTKGLLQSKATDGEYIIFGRPEFEGNDIMWIYYTQTSDNGAIRELRDKYSRIIAN